MSGGVLITNPHYVRPSAIAKGQTGGVRTPVSNGLPSAEEQSAATDNSQTKGQDADSTGTGKATVSSSLCSSEISNPSTNGQDDDNHNPTSDLCEIDKAGNLHIIGSGDGTSGGNGKEIPQKAQGGTDGSKVTSS